MEVNLKLRVSRRGERAFMGPGPADLLRGIARTGSIRKAAAGMGMSYVKALRLIKDIESGTGMKAVERRAGGPGGGGSSLSPFGQGLVRAYDAWASRVLDFAVSDLPPELSCGSRRAGVRRSGSAGQSRSRPSASGGRR